MRRLVVGPATLLLVTFISGRGPAAGQGFTQPPAAGRATSPQPALTASRQEAASPAQIGFATEDQRKRWRLRGDGYEVGFDSHETRSGARSLRLALAPGAVYRESAFAVASTHLAVEEARGKRLRFSGWIKSSAISRGWAGLWVRVEGAHGVLGFDNMGDHGVHGTTDWSHVEVAVDVPPETASIVLGALLAGDGAACVSDLAVALEPLSQVIEGKVVDPSGRPVGGALVAAVVGDGDQAAAVVRTGRDGNFHAVAPTGGVTLTATASAFAAAYQPPVDTRGEGLRDVTCRLGEGGPRLSGELKVSGALPPAGTRVTLARVKDEGGGWFYAELDSHGRFSVGLPAGRYQLTLDSRDFGAVSPGVVELTGNDPDQRVTFRAARFVAVPDEVVSWLKLHLVPLRTARPGQGFEDLRPLASMAGGARVVALGEATHGTREFFQLKHRVLEYLVSEMGFRVFAMEANWSEALAIDDYVLYGKGDPAEALGRLFSIWNTQEVLDMIEWMRAFNADPAHAQKVRFFGLDVQSSGVALRAVATYLDRVDAAYLREMADRLAAFPDDPHRAARADAASALATARALVGRLDAHRDDYVARSGRQEWELVRQHAVIVEESAQLAEPQEPDDRDRFMAENVGWILAHQPPGTRMMVWAHNAHVNYAKNRGGYTPMGEFLRRQLGSGYMNIGFLFDQGAFQSIRPSAQGSGGLHELSVDASPIDSLAAAFHRTGAPLALLDLRSCPAGGPVGAWLTAPHAVREAGAIFFDESRMWTIPTPVTDRFDALIYVDRTTRARPALARGR